MGKFTVLNHPLIQHKLTITRKKGIGTNEFRRTAGEIGGLMVYEIACDLPSKNVEIGTPIGESAQKELAGKKLVIVLILRTGLRMVDGVLQTIPSAKVGRIGIYRGEEILKPHEYFFKIPPDIEEHKCIIVDPVLATGGSINMTTGALKKCGAKNIRLAALVATPEGIKVIQEASSDVDIYTATEDGKLMGNGYAYPGPEDTGNRLFGTK